MIRDLPPSTVPESLRSVLASAGYGPPPTDEPVVPDTAPVGRDRAPPDPVLEETADSDLTLGPELDETPDPDEPDEPSRLDPERAAEPSASKRSGKGAAAVRPRGPVASFAVHAFALLAFFDWPAPSPVDPAQPIPVALVMEQPPPDMGKQPAPPPAPAGHLASDDMGDVTAKKSGAGAPAPAEAPKTEAAPPPPTPQEKPQQPESKPAKERVAALIPPLKPTPPAQPEAKPEAAPAAPPHPVETPHRAPRAARYPGPAATRDEYLAYLLTLTKQHFDLLPKAAVGDRQGETVVTILVLDDGTVARIGVSQSSGYPDIDARIEQMVAAVGRFPPLPQWYQGPRVELNLRLRFPEALEE
ncbi:MAG TPA: TonB family protein [Stellaceae bacterium]|jgi:protein TonB|nr:TonB family protein [Stellaceae bacterium]